MKRSLCGFLTLLSCLARSSLAVVSFGLTLSGAELPRPAVMEHRVIDEAAPLHLWGKCAADLNADGRPDLLVEMKSALPLLRGTDVGGGNTSSDANP